MHAPLVVDPVAALYLPGPQLEHVYATEAPIDVEYFPVPQGLHDVSPVWSWYVPAEQAVHAEEYVRPVVVPTRPTGQSSHVDSAVAAVDEEYFPVPQLVHALLVVDPVCVLYLPATQLEQDAWPDKL